MKQGRTQTWLAMQLSAKLGRPVYPQEAQRWCKAGGSTPVLGTREAIAEILSVPLSDLFPGLHDSGPSHTSTGADEAVGTRRAA